MRQPKDLLPSTTRGSELCALQLTARGTMQLGHETLSQLHGLSRFQLMQLTIGNLRFFDIQGVTFFLIRNHLKAISSLNNTFKHFSLACNMLDILVLTFVGTGLVGSYSSMVFGDFLEQFLPLALSCCQLSSSKKTYNELIAAIVGDHLSMRAFCQALLLLQKESYKKMWGDIPQQTKFGKLEQHGTPLAILPSAMGLRKPAQKPVNALVKAHLTLSGTDRHAPVPLQTQLDCTLRIFQFNAMLSFGGPELIAPFKGALSCASYGWMPLRCPGLLPSPSVNPYVIPALMCPNLRGWALLPSTFLLQASGPSLIGSNTASSGGLPSLNTFHYKLHQEAIKEAPIIPLSTPDVNHPINYFITYLPSPKAIVGMARVICARGEMRTPRFAIKLAISLYFLRT
eukprot:Gb_38346 [translate_table: standard]